MASKKNMSPLEGVNFSKRMVSLDLVNKYYKLICKTAGVLAAIVWPVSLFCLTDSMGRRDVFMAAISEPYVVFGWLLFVVLAMVCVFYILLTPAFIFGISVSMFQSSAENKYKIARYLFFPFLAGVFILDVFFYFFSDSDAAICLGFVVLGVGGLFFFIYRYSDFNSLVSSGFGGRSVFDKVSLIFFAVIFLLTAVLASVFPMMVVSKGHFWSNSKNPTLLFVLISFLTTVGSLIPVFVFLKIKGGVFRKFFLSVVPALTLCFIFLFFIRGVSSEVYYSVSRILGVREVFSASFVLDYQISLEDIDNVRWRTKALSDGRVEIEAFQLLAFGNVLLLCPDDLLGLDLSHLPQYTKACILTDKREVYRKPNKPWYFSRPSVGYGLQSYVDNLLIDAISWRKVHRD